MGVVIKYLPCRSQAQAAPQSRLLLSVPQLVKTISSGSAPGACDRGVPSPVLPVPRAGLCASTGCRRFRQKEWKHGLDDSLIAAVVAALSR